MDVQVVSNLGRLGVMMLLSMFTRRSLSELKFSFLMGRFLWLECLGQMVKLHFTFFRNRQAISRSGCTVVRSRQQVLPASPTLVLPGFLVLGFWFLITANLLGVTWCFVVVCGLNFPFLMTDEVEPLFLYLLAVCISSLVKYLLKPLAHF